MSSRPERYKENGSDRDFIDEFQQTKTPDEVRGAMLFSMGKYQRRYGKKDDYLAEAIKIADYANRLVEYERSLVATGAPEFDEERTDIVASSHGDGEHYAVDMRYAENWKVGDVVVCADESSLHGVKKGDVCKIEKIEHSFSGILLKLEGVKEKALARRFEFASRPVAEPSTEDMTDPRNWRAGDWVERSTVGVLWTAGKLYRIGDDGFILDDTGARCQVIVRDWRFHARPDADGWIKWEGGECPVDGDVEVEIITADGAKEAYPASGFAWRHDGEPHDIAYYRPHLATNQDKG